jgi:hypothetical protein
VTRQAELISNILTERRRLQATLARVDPDAMTVPGVAGDWSVRDIIAHLAVWCSRAVTLLFQAERGHKLSVPHSNAADWADVNAQDLETQKGRPIDRVLEDFHGAHAQLIRRLESWQDESVLFDAARFPVLNGRSLADHVWGDSGEHDAEHREQIEAWLARRG